MRSALTRLASGLVALGVALGALGGCKTLARWSQPADADRDGLVDEDDACPGVGEDHDGFDDGDGCPDLDNDGDGVLDESDRCPKEPEDRDGFQDDDGCPDADNDGDGIIDSLDRCALEAEDTDGVEDDDGCPDP